MTGSVHQPHARSPAVAPMQVAHESKALHLSPVVTAGAEYLSSSESDMPRVHWRSACVFLAARWNLQFLASDLHLYMPSTWLFSVTMAASYVAGGVENFFSSRASATYCSSGSRP